MNEYEINWQAESSNEELNILKSRIKAHWEYINSPMMHSFHILVPVRDSFKEHFDEYLA